MHSGTGLKLPIRAIANAITEANKGRAESDRVLLVVDGVHGLGVEDENAADMGADFFIAGTHKWMFGPFMEETKGRALTVLYHYGKSNSYISRDDLSLAVRSHGHMNVMWYTGKFDEASWPLLARLGLTRSYMQEKNCLMAAVQQDTSYKRELTISHRCLQ